MPFAGSHALIEIRKFIREAFVPIEMDLEYHAFFCQTKAGTNIIMVWLLEDRVKIICGLERQNSKGSYDYNGTSHYFAYADPDYVKNAIECVRPFVDVA